MIAIIPARGGSKGLPGKNIRLLNNIPLICYTVKAALRANKISRVIVSTDDDEIASIAKESGAEIPCMRPSHLAEDNSMVMDAYLYTVDWIKKDENLKIDAFVALLPSAPLRTAADIDSAVDIFNIKKADSVISVTESEIPVEWYRKINENGVLESYYPKRNAIKNRQEFSDSYVPNGAIYVFNVERLREEREYYMKETYPYIMPRERSVDIDELLDFEWAEFLLQQSNKSPKYA
jgi:CMP-N,N'-diacetyllegionaminic acid synthase